MGLGYAALLAQNGPLRLLWLGTVVSFLGDWLTTVAVLTVAQELSDSALVVSGVLVAKTLPIFLISPWAGSIADRMDRRDLMVATDLARAALVVLLIGAWWMRSLPAFMLLLTLRTLVSGFFIPARTAAVPDLAPGEQLPVAMALHSGTWSVMLALGAALGGVVTELVGVTGALVLDAFTFLGSAWLLRGLPALPPHASTSGRGTGFLDGLEVLRGRVYLPALLSLKAAQAVTGGVLVLLPLYAGGLYPGAVGPLYLGLLYAMRGVGSLVGSMGVRTVFGDAVDTMQRAIAPAFVGMAGMYALMAVAPDFWLLSVALGLAAVGTGAIWTYSATLAQLATDPDVRGRLFALEFGVTMLATSVVSLLVGGLLDAGLSPSAAMFGLATVTLLPGLAWTAVLRFGSDVQRVPA
jgi:MFS family permease